MQLFVIQGHFRESILDGVKGELLLGVKGT